MQQLTADNQCDFIYQNQQPFSFLSREYLRTILVGRVVQFQVLYVVQSMKREYGIILLPNSGGRSLPDLCVSEGWVRVRDDAARREGSDEPNELLDKLFHLQERAQAEEKGVFSPPPLPSQAEIETDYELVNAKALVETLGREPVEGIVERVITGDRLLLRLLLSASNHLQTLLAVAGIRTPSTRRVNADGVEISPAEPFGEQAHAFVEARLLQRRVSVTLVGFTDQGQLIGSVVHPKGNIAHYVLEAGLGRCNDLHSVLLKGEMTALRETERLARYEQKGIFKGVASKQPAARPVTDYIVSRVISADTLMVRNRAGEEKRISFSSVRQPKPSDPKQAPFVADAKEFLRKKLIGKHVKVAVDGKKPATEGFEERDVATVTINDTNVTFSLVEAGYASVIRHRRDDDDRSPDYDELVAAEELAQKKKEGIWSDKTPKQRNIVDYSESLQKAKVQASVLQRQRRVPGVVDFVKSGSRFTILLARESAKLTLVLSGIRAPRSARNPDEASEPFGQEAHTFASRRCMQREVEIDVETTDKVGGFIGSLYINRENFAKSLLEEGLATVHPYSAEQSGHASELYAAEEKAKAARRGLWHDWDPSKDVEEQDKENGDLGQSPESVDEASVPQRQVQYHNVTVTHIDPECRLKMQLIGEGTQVLAAMMNDFRKYHASPAAGQSSITPPPKSGTLVSAKFSEDVQWYRAKVRRNNREAQTSEVFYLDYGNVEDVPWKDLRPLPPQFSLQHLKPQALDSTLSLLQFPTAQDYTLDAIALIGHLTFNKQLVANRDAVAADGTWHVTLLDPATSNNLNESINAEIVSEGLAMATRKPRAVWERSAAAQKTLQQLQELEEEAKRERRGMWEYGDITED